MTLSIASITSSGIVLTADSRQTYMNKAGMTRIGTDSAVKLFKLNNKMAVVIAGKAFFPDSSNVFKNTGWFIEEFTKKILRENLWTVREATQKLNDYLIETFLNPEETRIKDFIGNQIEAENGKELGFDPREHNKLTYMFKDRNGKRTTRDYFLETVSMIVAGYDKDGIGRAYLASVPDGPTLERNTESGGCLWIGQTDIIARIVKGWGWEISSLDFIKDANKKGIKVDEELNKLEYIINWGTMTLQDAIDFNVLMTRITESIQRFSDGTFMNPGGITGVGGHVNVATLTPDEGFCWINKRELIIAG